MSDRASLKLLILVLSLAACGETTSVKKTSPSEEAQTNATSDDPYQSPGDGSVGASGLDPLSAHAWHLRNIGQTSFSTPNCLAGSCPYGTAVLGEDAGLGNSHSRFNKGSGVKVAISDNGTDIYHEDLYFNIDEGQTRNYESDDPNDWLGMPTPAGGSNSIAAHGTAVTGIIGALKGNSRGSFGIAPEATLIPFKYVGTSGSYAKEIDQAGGLFDIFNYSYGRSSCTYHYMNPSYLDALKYGVTNLRQGKGALYVKAAGNEYASYLSDCSGSDSDYYLGNANFEEDNSYPYLIVTSAMNAAGKSSSYSTPGSSVWITAPAGEFGDDSPAIISTDLMDCNHGFSKSNSSENNFESGTNPLNENCNYTSTMNGTSSAAPMVSGAIALLLAQRPELSWRDVKNILARSARQIDSTHTGTSYPLSDSRFPALPGHKYQEGWITNAAGFKFHNWFGFGALDIEAALELAANQTTTMPAYLETLSNGNWKYVKSLSLSVPDFSASGVSNSIGVTDNLIAEEVQVRLSVDHTRASDLGVELTSPSGTKSQLMLINSNIVDKKLNDVIFLSNAFYGESAQGQWTLKVIDARAGETGTLTRWGVHIFGHSASATPGVLAATNPSDRDLIAGASRSPGVLTYGVGASGASLKSFAHFDDSSSKDESSQSKVRTKSASRVISSSTTASLNIEETKREGLAPKNYGELCLLSQEGDLTLQYGAHKIKLIGEKSQVGLFAHSPKLSRIVIALRGQDGEALAKTLIFDQNLSLIDEGFLEGAMVPVGLAKGLFSTSEVGYLAHSGLYHFDLNELTAQKKFDFIGLSSLELTQEGSSCLGEGGAEEFRFDSTGLILGRQKNPVDLKEAADPWGVEGVLCLPVKEDVAGE